VPQRNRASLLDLESRLGHRLHLRNLPAQIPRDRLGDAGLPADLAYQLVHDHLMLDGNARLNLATFVGTWMEPEALQLMQECAEKNMIDKDEYPQTAELEERCLRILADLWHADPVDDAIGASAVRRRVWMIAAPIW
jgi:glutamate decarboxylase